MKDKRTSKADIKSKFHDGMRIMIGGFLGSGAPELLVDWIIECGVKDVELFSNDAWIPDRGVGKLIAKGIVTKLHATHIGMNPVAGQRVISGDLQAELIPMGSFVERIHAGGAGLGGVLTPTGLGTLVAEGKQIINVDGRDYILETPIRAEIAFLRATTTDTFGNCTYHGTSRNMNPIMAFAADCVIVEAENIVQFGDVDPDYVHTPGVVVDYIVDRGQYTC